MTSVLAPFCFDDERDTIARHYPHVQVVYFAQIEPGPVKVGIAKCPIRRLADIEVASPYEVTLLRVAFGGSQLEAYLHRRWRQHRIRGEWFEPAPIILDYIADRREAHKRLRRMAKLSLPDPVDAAIRRLAA